MKVCIKTKATFQSKKTMLIKIKEGNDGAQVSPCKCFKTEMRIHEKAVQAAPPKAAVFLCRLQQC